MTEVIEQATSQLSHADRWRLEAEAQAKAKAEAQAKAQRVRDEVELEYHSALLSGKFDGWPKAKADRARKILELSDRQLQTDQEAVKFARQSPTEIQKMNADLLALKHEEQRLTAHWQKRKQSVHLDMKLAAEKVHNEYKAALDAAVAQNNVVSKQEAEIQNLQQALASLPAWVTD